MEWSKKTMEILDAFDPPLQCAQIRSYSHQFRFKTHKNFWWFRDEIVDQLLVGIPNQSAGSWFASIRTNFSFYGATPGVGSNMQAPPTPCSLRFKKRRGIQAPSGGKSHRVVMRSLIGIVSICTYSYVYIYIYIFKCIYFCIYIYTQIYVYIFIYV